MFGRIADCFKTSGPQRPINGFLTLSRWTGVTLYSQDLGVSTVSVFWSILVHLMLVSFWILVEAVWNVQNFPNPISRYVRTTQFLITYFVLLVTFVTQLCQRRHFKNIYKEILKSDDTLMDNGLNLHYEGFHPMLKTLESIGVISLSLLLQYFFNDSVQWLRYFELSSDKNKLLCLLVWIFTRFWIYLGLEMAIKQYLECLFMINYRFVNIRKSLQMSYDMMGMERNQTIIRMKALVKAHCALSDSFFCLNRAFSVPVLTFVANIVIMVCLFGYHCAVGVAHHPVWYNGIIVSMVWIFFYSRQLVAIVSATDEVVQQAKMFNNVLIRLLVQEKNKDISSNNMLRMYAATNRTLKFSAGGLFMISYSMILKVAVIVCFVLVYSLQFSVATVNDPPDASTIIFENSTVIEKL